MDTIVTIEIPQQWLEGIKAKESTTIKQIFHLGLHQFKIQKALSLYQNSVGSLGYIAEQLGLPKADLIREARIRGIEPAFSEETVEEELGAAA